MAGLLNNFIANLVDDVNASLYVFKSLFITLLDLNFHVMTVVVSYLNAASSIIFDSLNALLVLVSCTCEDFLSFAGEIGQIFLGLTSCIHQSVVLFASSVQGAVMLVHGTFWCVILNIQEVYANVKYWIIIINGEFSALISVAKHSVLLVGSSVLLILQLVPHIIVMLVNGIFSASVYVMLAVYQNISNFTLSIKNTVKYTLTGIVHFVENIPFDAYVGLIIIIMVAVLTKHAFHHREVVMRFIPHFSILTSLRNLYQNVYAFMWRYVWQPLQLYWNRLENQYESENDEEEEDDDELIDQRLNAPSASLERHASISHEALLKDPSTTAQHLRDQLDKERENQLCAVCQDAQKCVILLPCRHVCLCLRCRDIILRNGDFCPMCRHPIRESMHVFL